MFTGARSASACNFLLCPTRREIKMVKRYKKDYKVDGWPVMDTERQSILGKDDIVNILNEQDHQINEMKKLLSDMANNAVFQRPLWDSMTQYEIGTEVIYNGEVCVVSDDCPGLIPEPKYPSTNQEGVK